MSENSLREMVTRLANAVAPSGFERSLSETLLNEVSHVADRTRIDALGNGIAQKDGAGLHVALIAHVDEPGVMVIDADENGFLRLISLGNLKPVQLVNRQVTFMNGVVGLVVAEDDVDAKDISYDDLFVDIGAPSREQALSRLDIGMAGVIVDHVEPLGPSRLTGRALDNRAGCAIAMQAFCELAKADCRVSLVLTSQNEVGARGARTAAYQLNPDLALIVDSVIADDAPVRQRNRRSSIQLGAGPAVKILDATAIVPVEVKTLLIETAKQEGIDIQYEVSSMRPSDAGAVQLSVDGIRIGGISYPARYVSQNQTVIDLDDLANGLRLLTAAAKRYLERVNS